MHAEKQAQDARVRLQEARANAESAQSVVEKADQAVVEQKEVLARAKSMVASHGGSSESASLSQGTWTEFQGYLDSFKLGVAKQLEGNEEGLAKLAAMEQAFAGVMGQLGPQASANDFFQFTADEEETMQLYCEVDMVENPANRPEAMSCDEAVAVQKAFREYRDAKGNQSDPELLLQAKKSACKALREEGSKGVKKALKSGCAVIRKARAASSKQELEKRLAVDKPVPDGAGP